MNPGVSFAMTTFFPSRRSAKSRIAPMTAGSVSAVGITSSSGRYRGGLKKCVPSQCRGNRRCALPARCRNRQARRVGTDDRALTGATASTRSSSDRFASGCSIIASMIQSACATHSQIGVEPAGSDAAGCVGREKWIGLELSCTFESLRARPAPTRPAQRRDTRRWPDVQQSARPSFRRLTHMRIVFVQRQMAFLPCYTPRRCSFNLEVLSMSLRFLLALAACCFSLSLVVAGQTRATTGDLGGTIVDQSSAVLPGATVTAQNVETNHVRSAMTDDRGHFLIPALPPGTYTVKAELQGFTPRTLEDVVVTLGSLIDVRLSLNVAGGQEVVLVAGDAPVIDTQRTAVSNVISQAQIEHLPINGRNFIGFSLLAPGVATDLYATAGGVRYIRPHVCRAACAIEQHHRRWPRQQRLEHRQRARDVQPGSREGVPGAHQLVFCGVRQGIRRGRQHRDEERHEHDGGESVLFPSRRRPQLEGSLRALQSCEPAHRTREGAVLAEAVRRDVRRAVETGSHVLFPVLRTARRRRAQLRHD